MPRGQASSQEGVARCLDDETLALLIDGALDPEEDARVRAHIDTCDACRRLFADAARAGEPEPSRASGPQRAFLAGDVVAGKYQIVRELGEGGMGVVLAARHLDLAQMVALKVLRPELGDDTDAIRRFAREAKAAAALKSEHTVRIFDVGRLEDGLPYMVMEYLEGFDLATKLENEGPLPIEDAVEYVLQACDALAEAHELGLVHRDLKPHNLFLTQGRSGRPIIKVLDFGLAKALVMEGDRSFDDEESMTGTNVMLGSPFFMSPEQAGSGRRVDPRSDIWSLGATLYHLLTGTPPFVAPNLHVLCARILHEDFRSVRKRRPATPPSLEVVLRRCMSRDPDDRYPNVGELARALESVLEAPAPSGDTTIGNATTVEREALVTKGESAGGLPASVPIAMDAPNMQTKPIALRTPPPPPPVEAPATAISNSEPPQPPRISTIPRPPPPPATPKVSATTSAEVPPMQAPPRVESPRSAGRGGTGLVLIAAVVIIGIVAAIGIRNRRIGESLGTTGGAPIETSGATTATTPTSTATVPAGATTTASSEPDATSSAERTKPTQTPPPSRTTKRIGRPPASAPTSIYDHP